MLDTIIIYGGRAIETWFLNYCTIYKIWVASLLPIIIFFRMTITQFYNKYIVLILSCILNMPRVKFIHVLSVPCNFSLWILFLLFQKMKKKKRVLVLLRWLSNNNVWLNRILLGYGNDIILGHQFFNFKRFHQNIKKKIIIKKKAYCIKT